MAKNGMTVKIAETKFPVIGCFFNRCEYNHIAKMYMAKKITALNDT